MRTITAEHRILLVQDDPTLQTLLATVLQGEGYTTESASTLEAALTNVEEQLYDLIVTELLETILPRREDATDLEGVRRLCQACHPTPVGLLTTWPIDLEAATRAGVAFALQLPCDLEDILGCIADSLNASFTPEQDQQAQLLRRFLEAVSQGDEATLRVLCTSTVAYSPLTRSVFTKKRAILGIDAYLAYVRLVHQQLPASRMDQVVIVTHKGRLIARYLWSWQGPDGQRQQITGSIQCHFRGELVAQIGEALPTQRLHRLLEPPQAPPG